MAPEKSDETLDNLHKVLDTILGSFLELVQCDAGSVFTVRTKGQDKPVLAFEAMITRSINLRGVPEHLRNLEFNIDDSSIVGKTALHKKPMLLNLTSGDGRASPRVNELLGYVTRNILSGPLITPRGDLVGVVQLLNKLPRDGASFNPLESSSLPDFGEDDERLFLIIAGQAALAIENSVLLEEQERLIEGFVDANTNRKEAEAALNRSNDEIQLQRLRVFKATMRTVQDIVNNLLTGLQLVHLEAEGQPPAETQTQVEQIIRETALKLETLGNLETVKEKEMAIGLGIEYPGATSPDSVQS